MENLLLRTHFISIDELIHYLINHKKIKTKFTNDQIIELNNFINDYIIKSKNIYNEEDELIFNLNLFKLFKSLINIDNNDDIIDFIKININ
jgi:hypothetical protein